MGASHGIGEIWSVWDRVSRRFERSRVGGLDKSSNHLSTSSRLVPFDVLHHASASVVSDRRAGCQEHQAQDMSSQSQFDQSWVDFGKREAILKIQVAALLSSMAREGDELWTCPPKSIFRLGSKRALSDSDSGHPSRRISGSRDEEMFSQNEAAKSRRSLPGQTSEALGPPEPAPPISGF